MTEYFINDEAATKQEYESLYDQLENILFRYCDDMSDGGCSTSTATHKDTKQKYTIV